MMDVSRPKAVMSRPEAEGDFFDFMYSFFMSQEFFMVGVSECACVCVCVCVLCLCVCVCVLKERS
jgi:hypothetical protein